MSFDVISFGSALVDIFLESEEFKLVKPDGGETAICQVYGDKIEVSRRKICSGGGGTNSAVSFARQGLSAAVCGRMGKDTFGQIVIKEMEKEGVDTALISQQPEETDSSIILIGPDGGRTILVCRGQTRLEKTDLNWERLDANWFYITSLEGNIDLAEEIIDFAKTKNIKVVWNPGKKELKSREMVASLVGRVNVFNLNRTEMEKLVDKNIDDQSFWQAVRNLGAELTVVTNGKKGAYLLYKKGLHFLPVEPAEAIDATGAGDAFGSGFVGGLIRGLGEKQAFDFAMKNAASVVGSIGAKSGLLKC
jgi:sugar/nucleoside kinase (ribokinase family)